MRDQVLQGDALEQLKTIPSESVQVCVTSPPYYALRDYSTRQWFGGDPTCDHDTTVEHGPHHPGQVEQTKWKNADAAGNGQTATTNSCSKCGGWFGQLGLEPVPSMYVEHLVQIFREVWRVLRPDGILWLNLGDSYANDSKWGGSMSGKHAPELHGSTMMPRTRKTTGFKGKDLMMIPHRVAMALQEDGWWVRSDVVWAKGNPLPEAVQDRPSRSHEYVFMLTKSQFYYYDITAIYEDGANDPGVQRNRRTVWNINQLPYRGAHFATMPEEIPRLCIKAASSEKGACPACGAPWARIIERGKSHYAEVKGDRHWTDLQTDAEKKGWVTRGGPTLDENGTMPSLYAAPRRELGWEPTCTCPKAQPVPCIVLDPFAGSGTTLSVAKALGRDYIGVELNPAYLKLIAARVRKPTQQREDDDIYEWMMGND